MNNTKKNLNELFKILHIKPKKTDLYIEALTHKTYSNENKERVSYEKLEFVGDSILQMYSSLYIYKEFKNVPEGTMSIIRSKNVSKSTLAKIIKENGINRFLICSNNIGELKNNEKICSDIFESLLAAIFLDLGHKECWKFLEKFLFKRIKITPKNENDLKDPKTRLQEYLQPLFKNPIQYVCTQQKNTSWLAKAICCENIYGIGKGKTKKEAEIAAAKDALNKLKI